jgi:hypothetical protein
MTTPTPPPPGPSIDRAATHRDWLDGSEFVNAMHAFRNAPHDLKSVVTALQRVKELIRSRYVPRLKIVPPAPPAQGDGS